MADTAIDRVIESVNFVNGLSLNSQIEMIDRIFQNQPILLSHVLVLSKLNVSKVKMDHVLHLLMVFYHCFTENETIKYPEVSEDMICSIDNNTISMLHWFDKEDPSNRQNLMEMSIRNYPEKNVLAYMVSYLQENGFDQDSSQENEYWVYVETSG